MTEYPRRDKYFAHRLTRLLFKSCACQEIGHHAVCLLCHIAHTEDAARYQGPVTFWNEQLMTTLGFTHRKQLIKARDLAIGAGWLHYDRAHDRAVGYYWTDIPASVSDFNDSPIEPASMCTPQDTEVSGLCTSQGTGVGTGVGTGMGTPSTLSLSRIPKEESPNGDGRLVRKKGKAKPKAEAFDPTSVEMPAELGEAFRPDWLDWCKHRREIGKSLTETSVKRQMKMLAGLGFDKARQSVENAIQFEWRGLYPPKDTDSATPNHTPRASADSPSLLTKKMSEPN
jgi:hypothetical protein